MMATSTTVVLHLLLSAGSLHFIQERLKEDILLGTLDESISNDEIERAIHEANIYGSTSLPNGFNAVVGSKGILL